MALHCSNCSQVNPDGSAFCIACGKPLAQTTSSDNAFPPSPSKATASFAYQASQTSRSQSSTVSVQQIVPMGTIKVGSDQEALAYLRAFAGYGVSVMHHSWLLEGDSARASDLFSAVMDILRQRNMLGLTLSMKNLRERGYQTEERHYLIVQRGVTTVFIYIAPAGRDLYISRATSVKPSIDPFRVINLLFLVAVALFAPGILIGLASGSSGASSIGVYAFASFFSTFVSLPIWLYLLWFLYRSFRYWLRERDFWIYLRARSLNDFQMDDIMLLEHATDETVLSAVKQLNLDASKIVPPVQGYRPERRIRII